MTLGKYCFAVALIGSGIQQLYTDHFVRLVPKLPPWIPWPSFWACLVGVMLIFIGLLLATGKMVRAAAVALGAMLLATLVFQRVPEIIANPWVGFIWTAPFKVLALLGGVVILTATSPGETTWPRKLLPLGPILFGAFLVLGGVQHFVYATFVETLVPAWIPPGQAFWTYFAGVALIAAGLGIFLPATRYWAGTLAGVMIFLWVPLLHIPRAVAGPNHGSETSGVFEALALSGVAFLISGAIAGKREEVHELEAEAVGPIERSV